MVDLVCICLCVCWLLCCGVVAMVCLFSSGDCLFGVWFVRVRLWVVCGLVSCGLGLWVLGWWFVLVLVCVGFGFLVALGFSGLGCYVV